MRQIHTPVKTTLYDLIEAGRETVNPENEPLVNKIVLDLLNIGRSNISVQ